MCTQTIRVYAGQPRGVVFRFEREGATGLIKVIPSAAHESLLNDFSFKVGSDLQNMGSTGRTDAG